MAGGGWLVIWLLADFINSSWLEACCGGCQVFERGCVRGWRLSVAVEVCLEFGGLRLLFLHLMGRSRNDASKWGLVLSFPQLPKHRARRGVVLAQIKSPCAVKVGVHQFLTESFSASGVGSLPPLSCFVLDF